jgi:formate dehydrogenase (NADP+) alpha subunit
MSAINLIIDGKEIAVAPGTTILQAARELGIDIPTFCYDPELAPNGACRICVVEVENARALVASCVTPVGPEMVVHTESERVISARKSILSLLVANHPLVCITCEKTGECKLQDYCYRYGVADSEYSGEVKELPLDASNAFFIRDMNKCILCGICVGKCQEVVGAGAIDFTRRGFVSNIGPAFEDSIEESTCVFCGLCIDNCPVGALTPKFSIGQGRPWEVEEVRAVCPYCSIGCNIKLQVKGNNLIGVNPVKESPVNRGHLCARGKFGWDYLNNGDRITTPLVKSDGVFVKVSWEEALGFIIDNLEGIKSRYGADALMGLCSPKASNEEAYLLQKLIRSLGSNNIDSYTRHCHAPAIEGLMQAFGSAAMTNSIEELANTGAVFVIGANLAESHPVLNYRVREAANRNGARLIIVHGEPIDLMNLAHHTLILNQNNYLALVNALARIIIEEGLADQAFINKRAEGFELFKKALSDIDIQKAADLAGITEEELRTVARAYATAERAAIISAVDLREEDAGHKLVLALANLALLTGNLGKESAGLYLPYGENNFQGIADMGALPGFLSGYQPVNEKRIRDKFARAWGLAINEIPGKAARNIFRNGKNSAIKALYVLGENPIICSGKRPETAAFLANLDFLVVQDIFMTETASLADVVLPAAAFAEQTGTYTNTERRVQLSQAAVEPPGEAYSGWAILAELAGWLGFEWNYKGPEDVFTEIASLTPQYTGISYQRLMQEGLQWPCSSGDHPGTKFLYEGRFSRGLGLFSVVSDLPLAKTAAGKLPVCGSAGDRCCQCQSENMSRRSVISILKK